MNYRNGRMLSFYLVGIFIALLSFFSANVNALAANHGFEVRVAKCPTENYAGKTGRALYTACASDYYKNNLSSYVIEPNGTVEPGTLVMFAIHYINNGNDEVIAYDTKLEYQGSFWTPEEVNNKAFTSFNTSKFPAWEGETTAWTNQASISTVGGKNYYVVYGSDTTEWLPIEGDLALGVAFFRLNSDATPGATLTFNFDAVHSSVSRGNGSQEKLPTDVKNLTLFVAGGAKSKDATLGTLGVTGSNGKTYSLSPTFVPGAETPSDFSTTVPYDVTSIDISATVHDENAQGLVISKTSRTRSVSAGNDLNVGTNSFNVIVTSEEGTIGTYNIDVKRLNNVATLDGINFTNGVSISGFSSGTKSYTINNVPYAVHDTVITPVLTDSNGQIKSGDGTWNLTNYGANTNTRNIVVQAENCKAEYASVPGNSGQCVEETYTLNLNRVNPSNNGYLSSLKVDNVLVTGFQPSKLEYTLDAVPYNKTSINVLGVVADTGKATIKSGNGNHTLNVGDNTINVVVTAEDGVDTTYKIHVRRLNNVDTLSNLTVSSTPTGTLFPSFSSETKEYSYSYPATVTSVDVSATVTDLANATVGLSDITSGASASAGTGATASETYGIATKKVAALVTAEDGTIKVYTITFNRAQSSNNNLASLTVTKGSTNYALTPRFSANEKTYTLEVSSDIDSVDINAAAEEPTLATVTGTGTKSLNFGLNEFKIGVKAENNSTAEYTVKITRKMSNDPTLATLTVDGVPVAGFSPNTETYNLPKVLFSKSSVIIDGTFTNSYASFVSGNGTVNLKTGPNALKVVTRAQDGTEKTYTINIERSKNKDASVQSVTVHGKAASLTGDRRYEVTLPNNYDTLAPGDVNIVISDDATISKPNNTINLVTTDVNHYAFTVTAEDTSIVLPYEILITREKASDKSIGKVTLTLSDGTTAECTMNGTTCNISVPVNTTGFRLNAEIPGTATISPSNGTNHTMGASESIKDIPLTVTAEDNSTAQYTVHVERQKSDDNDLSDLTINGSTVTGFSPSTTLYENISVPAGTNQVTIAAVVNDTGKATIETDLSQPFNLDFGVNTINVVVKAENNKTKTYTLKVTREKGTDASLSDLTINGTTVSGFSSTTLEYPIASVDYNTIALNIGATTTDPLASVTGTGSIPLKTGDNEIPIEVTAHDGVTKQTYKIKVYREKNTDVGIKGITVGGVSATHEGGVNYSVTVPNSVNNADGTNVIVTPNDPRLSTDPLATYVVTPTPLSTKVDNNVAITVTSESGRIETYVVKVTREKSNIATLDTLTVTGGSFSPSFSSGRLEYDVTVPVNTTGFDINATKTDPESNITSGIGHVDMGISESTMTRKVVVVSENGQVTKEYILNIKRTESSVNTLGSLTVSSDGTNYPLKETFEPEKTRYTVEVPGNVDHVDVAAVLTDGRATIESGTGNHDLVVGNNTITVRVRSESGSPLDYTIVVTRARKTDAKLTELKVDGFIVPGFDPEIEEYTIPTAFPNNKTSVSVEYVKSDSDATVTGDIPSKSLVTGDNDIVVVVTAQDTSVTKTYTVHVTREKSDNNKLAILSFVGGFTLDKPLNETDIDYEITVPETKDVLRANEITALPQDNTATVVKTSGDLTLSTTADNYYSIMVQAENGNPRIYRIKVNRPKSTDATLREVRLNNATLATPFSPTTYDYTLNIPYGTTSFEITGIPNVSATVVSGNGTYNYPETQVIQLVTLAEAGGENTKTYTFNVVEAKSNDATLTDLSISGYPFKDSNGANIPFSAAISTYNIGNIPYGVAEALVNATPANAASNIEYLVGTNTQSSNRVTIPQVPGTNSITVKVTAPDGITKQDYIITYNIVYSDNAYLSGLVPSVGSIPFNKTTFGYELNVNNEVNSIDFDITTEDPNARITVNGSSFATPKRIAVSDLPVGNTTLSIIVTAQDGHTRQTYDVLIKKAAPVASSDATLKSLEVLDHPFATEFSPETKEYTIGTIPYGLEHLTINAVPNVGGSKVTYSVNGVAQASNVVNIPKTNGNGEIVVRVIAEDGITPMEYKITYSKTASNNAYLSSLTVTEGTIDFNKTTLDYTVDIGNDVTSVSYTATAEDSNATIKIGDNSYTSPHTATVTPLNTRDNKVNIEVVAEDGTKVTYTVNFKKGGSTPDPTPDKITSEEYGHNIDDDYIRTVMVDTTAGVLKNDQLDNDAQYLEVWTADDSAQVQDDDKLGTGMIIKLIINGEEKDRKVIVVIGDTSGDGRITMYDANIIVGHFTKTTLMTGAYLVAGDTSYDDKITMYDANIIVGHYTKTTPITSPIVSGN